MMPQGSRAGWAGALRAVAPISRPTQRCHSDTLGTANRDLDPCHKSPLGTVARSKGAPLRKSVARNTPGCTRSQHPYSSFGQCLATPAWGSGMDGPSLFRQGRRGTGCPSPALFPAQAVPAHSRV